MPCHSLHIFLYFRIRALIAPSSIPTDDTFRRLFARLDPEQFGRCFLNFAHSLHTCTKGEVIALDGKAVRHSFGDILQQKLHAFFLRGRHGLQGSCCSSACEGWRAESMSSIPISAVVILMQAFYHSKPYGPVLRSSLSVCRF